MSEQTGKQYENSGTNPDRTALAVHFPAFVHAEGRFHRADTGGHHDFPKGSSVHLHHVGDTARIGDCVVKVKGFSKRGDIHIDLYPDSQGRVPANQIQMP